MLYANNYSEESNINGEKIIDFPWSPKELQITNDSSSGDLKYKFNKKEVYRTLKPYETSTLTNISINELYLSGSNVDYRVWGLG